LTNKAHTNFDFLLIHFFRDTVFLNYQKIVDS
jgi:hypothetical protein